MRLKILVLFCAVFGGLVAQQPSPDPTPGIPLFSSTTRLVQVDAIVSDKNGPVTGLTKADFTVLDNGKPQQIAIFSVRKAEDVQRSAPLPAGVVANRPQSQGGEPVAATVILFDTLNTGVEAQSFARAQALNYIRRAGRTEQIAVYSLSKTLKPLQEFTDDRDLLIRAIQRFQPETSLDLTSGDLTKGLSGNGVSELGRISRQRREDGTAAAFATVARHLSGLPGRKKLVWITSSLPMSFSEEQQHNGIPTMEYQDFSPQVDRSLKTLNDANVGVYPIDPRGSSIDLLDPNLTTMGLLARLTGGKPPSPTNELASEMEQVMTDTDLTYTLGYYRTGDELDGKFHTITVRVNRPGVDVRNRQGYEALKPRVITAKKNRRTLNAWVQEPLEATDIAINGRATPATNRPGFYRVDVAVSAAELQLEQKNGRWVGSFDLAIAPDIENHPKGLLQTIKVNLTPERLQLALVTGIEVTNTVRATGPEGRLISRQLHVVVMDNASGNAGSVRLPIGANPQANSQNKQNQRPPQAPGRGGRGGGAAPGRGGR